MACPSRSGVAIEVALPRLLVCRSRPGVDPGIQTERGSTQWHVLRDLEWPLRLRCRGCWSAGAAQASMTPMRIADLVILTAEQRG